MTRYTLINAFTVAKEGLELSPNNKTPMYAEAIELYSSLIALLKTGLEFTEANYCVQIIKAFLEAGYSIKIHDGEEWALTASKNLELICESLNSTGDDQIIIMNGNQCIGWLSFIYDNGGPEYLVSDYSANTAIESILNPIYERHFSE